MNVDRESKVAIVGLGCRFPGSANTAGAFWKNIADCKNAISDIPQSRWEAKRFYNTEGTASGKSYVRKGHFVDWNYKEFDAGFFNFAPREVEFYDPQQRLLLEVSWEALEDAGIDPTTLAGRDVGVYVGGFTLDHMLNQLGSSARSEIGTHSASGATLTMLSNRLSYAYDLRGPSISVDTACSSSLVAFSYAVNDIGSGVCEMAVVGGVNFMLRPEYPIAMSKGQFLARDGLSKSFDSRADGYGRGEGAGVVILKSLQQALADSDHILAVVDAVGVNQDGRTSSITVPSAESQQVLMEKVVARASLTAQSIQYVEAHGTGTPVGDPIEASAIASVYGQQRADLCKIGSLKSNIGHLEAAAGVASIIKVCMMLKHNKVPPLATLKEPNPNIPFGENGLMLATELSPLAAEGETRRIAINSFGYGGTNAHAILSLPPEINNEVMGERKRTVGKQSCRLLPVSARSQEAVKILAKEYLQLLHSGSKLDDVIYSASRRRGHLEHRLALWGKNDKEMLSVLDEYVEKGYSPQAAEGRKPFTGQVKPVFIYTGMGPQWWGMGQGLYQGNAVFREAVEHADEIFQEIAGFSIKAEMMKSEEDSRITETQYAQPANFVIQYALTETMRSEGLEPAAVVGHSVGEISSAWAAGMLSLRDALHVAFYRSQIQKKAAHQGGMLAVGLTHDEALEAITIYQGKVSIAAINSPTGVTLAGDSDCLDELREQLEARDVFARALAVEVPYHSPMMEPLKPELMEKLSSLTPVEPTIPLYSTVTGERITDIRYDAAYWCENVRNPVYFEKAIRTLIDDDYRVFIEVGPHPVLRNAIKEICTDVGTEVNLCQTLNRKQRELEAFYQSIATAYAEGADLQWQLRHPEGHFIKLPVYPWQREVLWREPESQRRDRLDDIEHPLLGMKIPAANVWRSDLADYRLNYLQDHVVDGLPIMPAAGYIEAMIECAQGTSMDSGKGWRLTDISIEKALVLDSGKALNMEVTVNEAGDTFTVKSFDEQSPDQVSQHASAFIYPLRFPGSSRVDIQDLLAKFEKPLQADKVYQNFTKFSMQYKPLFQPIACCYLKDNGSEVISQLVLPDDLAQDSHHYQVHPSLLDGCLQTVLCLLDPEKGAFLPTAINEMKIYGAFPARMYCHGRMKKRTARKVECDLWVCDEDGNIVASINGLVCSALLNKDKRKEYPEGDLRFEWKAEELGDFTIANKKWLAIEEGDVSIFDTICTNITQQTSTDCTVASMDEVVSGSIDTTKFDAVLYMADSGYDNTLDPVGIQASTRLLELIQMLAKAPSTPRLYIVTRSAFIIDAFDTSTIPAQGALVGLSRVAFNEIENLNATIIDLPKMVDDENIAALLKELLSNRNKDEVALRSSGRYFSELLPSGLFSEAHETTLSAGSDDRFELVPAENGNAFGLIEVSTPKVAADEVELKIEAINLPQNITGSQGNVSEPGLTGVCARITRVGMNVSNYNAGDRVAGIIPFALSSHALVSLDAGLLVNIDNAVPASFVASEAICRVSARRIMDAVSLSAGSTALVCENALGQALSSLLKKKQIDVITVSANQHDWGKTSIDDIVGDKNVSLLAVPVEEWDKSFGFNMLVQGGIVVDLANNESAFMCRHNIGSMIRYSLASDLKNNKAQVVQCLHEVMTGNTEEFKGQSTKLKQFVHNGPSMTDDNLVLDFDDDSELPAQAMDTVNIFPDAVYLVTGGFGGLGKETAKWLARHGAGHIVLCSRRAGESHDDQVFMEMLGAMGSHVTAQPCDLSKTASVQNMIKMIEGMGMPFKGIFHTAGLLEDKPVEKMTKEDMHKVMLPKASGAWNLHATTQAHKLDHFVLYSSISVLLGNSRQANYCAANGFLDALARYRQLHNQAGMSINWGAIGSVGMLSQDSKIGDHLTQIGLSPLSFNLGLNGMERAISTGQVNISISSQPEWGKWSGYEMNAVHSSRYRTVLEEAREEHDDSVKSRLSAKLAVLDQEVQTQVLTSLVSEVFATALKMPVEQIDPSRPLESLGVDSLMATEIRVSLDATLGVSISALELIGSSSISVLAHKCLDQLQIDNQEDIAA